MKFLRKINLEINKDLYNPIQVKQNDTARYLLFNLLDNGVPFSLENKTVRVYGLKPDGTKVFNNLTIINAARGLAELQLTTQMLVKPGCLKLELVIYEATDILSTTKFDIDVIASLRDDAAIESTNEFSALTLGLSKLDEWDKYFKETSGAIEEKYTERLNEINSSLEEKANVDKFKRVSSEVNGVKRKRKPILVFVSDDLHPNDWNYRDIFINNGVACSIPIACTNLTDDLVQKCLTLQNNYGYEFGSHTVNHKDLTSITLKEVEYELSESKKIIESKGLLCNNFYIPYGKYTTDVLDIAKKYYRAVRTSNNGYNKPPIPTFSLKSYWIDPPNTNGETLEEFKAYVDTCKADNSMLIFGFHTGTVDRAFMENTVDVLIKYAKSIGVEIMTLDKALDNIGNSIDIGSHYNTPSTDGFVIDCEGKIWSKYLNSILPINNVSNILSSHIPSDTEKLKITLSEVTTSNATGYPRNKAGLLVSFKSYSNDYILELYSTRNGQLFYRNANAGNPNVFNAWNEILTSASQIDIIDNTKTINSPPTGADGFLFNHVTHTSIMSSNGTPTNTRGQLKTVRFDLPAYQEFTPENKAEKWMRWATSGTAWGEFTKMI